MDRPHGPDRRLRLIGAGIERLLRLRDVAARLDVSVPTARNLVKRGELPHLRVSMPSDVRAEDFEEFLRRAEGAEP